MNRVIVGAGPGVIPIVTFADAERAYGKGSLLARKVGDHLDPNRLRTMSEGEARRRRAMAATLVPVLVNGRRWWSDKARTVAAATKREVMVKIARRYAGGGR